MNRSLAALAAAAMLAASVPSVGFAEETTTVDATVTSETSGNDWKKPCENLTGLLKAQCIVKHNPGAKRKKDRMERRSDDKALNRTSRCMAFEGKEKIACIRKLNAKTARKPASNIRRTIRGKVIEMSTESN